MENFYETWADYVADRSNGWVVTGIWKARGRYFPYTAGPFADRKEADKQAARMRRLGAAQDPRQDSQLVSVAVRPLWRHVQTVREVRREERGH